MSEDKRNEFNMTPEMLLLSIWSLTKVPPSISPRIAVLGCIEKIVDDWYDHYRTLHVIEDDNN